jgi:hypothetical protein
MKFDPFEQMTKAWETWQSMADESIARTTSFYEAMDKVEAKGVERAESAIHEMAKLTRETLAYNTQLAAEWRRLSLETLQRTTAAFKPAV